MVMIELSRKARELLGVRERMLMEMFGIIILQKMMKID